MKLQGTTPLRPRFKLHLARTALALFAVLATLVPDVHGLFRGVSGHERVLVQDDRHPGGETPLTVLAALSEDSEEDSTRDGAAAGSARRLAWALSADLAMCPAHPDPSSSSRFCAHRATGPPTI